MAETELCFCEADILKRITIPLSRCNVPPHVLASLTYQQYPVSLELDGVWTFYRDLFDCLVIERDASIRQQIFTEYMAVKFRLPEAHLLPRDEVDPVPKPHANYRRLLFGCLFDSNSDSGAVWRQWVESRFGLMTLYHHELIPSAEAESYLRYLKAYARVAYMTNELFSQLDLLYSFCQYQLAHRFAQSKITLYRGGTQPVTYSFVGEKVILLNNLSSFAVNIDEAYRFGSYVVEVEVPLSKVICFDSLLPRGLSGEQEFMVLGGLYRAKRVN